MTSENTISRRWAGEACFTDFLGRRGAPSRQHQSPEIGVQYHAVDTVSDSVPRHLDSEACAALTGSERSVLRSVIGMANNVPWVALRVRHPRRQQRKFTFRTAVHGTPSDQISKQVQHCCSMLGTLVRADIGYIGKLERVGSVRCEVPMHKARRETLWRAWANGLPEPTLFHALQPDPPRQPFRTRASNSDALRVTQFGMEARRTVGIVRGARVDLVNRRCELHVPASADLHPAISSGAIFGPMERKQPTRHLHRKRVLIPFRDPNEHFELRAVVRVVVVCESACRSIFNCLMSAGRRITSWRSSVFSPSSPRCVSRSICLIQGLVALWKTRIRPTARKFIRRARYSSTTWRANSGTCRLDRFGTLDDSGHLADRVSGVSEARGVQIPLASLEGLAAMAL